MRIKNLLITDDHAYIIDGIIAGLREKFEIENLTTCYSPKEAIEQVEKQKYDLYILDLGFRSDTNIDLRQLEYIHEISKLDTQASIIVFTMREDFALISLLSKIKQVKGVVLKGPEKTYLQEAVEAVLNGNNYLCPRFKSIHKRSEEYRKRAERTKLKNGLLDDKEIMLLRMLAAGETSYSISQKMGYEESTIKSYRRDLKDKLNVSSTIDMILLGIILNYISIDDLAIGILSRER